MTAPKKKLEVSAEPSYWTPERVLALRTSLGLMQVELSEKLRVGQAVVSAWEKGRRRPSRQSALLLKLLAESAF